MDMVGGWSSDTICEATDLGLSIIEHGWLTHYTNQRYGEKVADGIPPLTCSLARWRRL
jgi:cellulose synthase/poly-beta-1,6-N-acetylglucosamine synthase-like glycosyltransferase